LVVLVVLFAAPLAADNPLREAGDAVVENVELSLLGGTVGWGAGSFWPIWSAKSVDIGPFTAFGSKLAGGGLGARLPVYVPILGNFVDFVGAGGAVKYPDMRLEFWRDMTFEVWVGKTILIDSE